MITLYDGFKPENTATDRIRIPAGGYVCKILKAEVENTKWGDKLKITFDVAEGEYKGYFRKDWDTAQPDRQKWRGILRINIPNAADKYFDSNRNIFNGFAWNLENSNPGYSFTGDESKLVGKLVGIIIRDKQYRLDDGTEGFWSEPYSTRTVDCVWEGKYKMPAQKMLKGDAYEPASAAPTPVVTSDDELPF